ncbi:AbrB/MazE/SpoVT family DNA-binding domain-containing protein [uncultured Jannaschia sp.]|uniref:AbrB/MazE/SpoVT family DNA-binding domain-containing protein n=1 Tax=uncultured Jannaschia sp. TaxID=293347 RepID=UPI002633275B|nr:AbrB/MazE/SpoVT family DNA-binding domain-containing protein [uncultured Jannaschia sp.]
MRMTSKGQVTIPQHIREAAGFLPGTDLEFVMDDAGTVRVRRHNEQPENPALTEAIGRLRGSATRKMTTDEIMALTRE